jgi:ubiquinone/menaquinone biosynthesis C-methylase UbiE
MKSVQSSNTSPRQIGDLGKMAGYYDLVMLLVTQGRERKLRQTTLELAQIRPGDKVLEIGCGTGTLSMAAKEKVGPGGIVAGIDIAPEMVAKASSKAVKKGLDVTFQVASIEKVPFPDAYFDRVLCSFMIYHMPEDIRRKGLAEISRVLKPRGRLFIIDTVDLNELSSLLKEYSFKNPLVAREKLNLTTLWYLSAEASKS